MSKVQGPIKAFAYIRDEGSRTVISYEKENISKSEAYWQEAIIPKTKRMHPSLQEVKQAVLDDINQQTRQAILTGFVWNDKPIWLSDENQRNFSEMQRLGITGRKEKLGEDQDGNPVYHTFTSTDELDDFYFKLEAYIHQCLDAGRDRKDDIDWAPYEALFPVTEPNVEP